MRVLLVPEVYRSEVTACGTLNDAVTWVDEWLARDDRLHVYWLLPPRRSAGYDAEYVRADRERVTLLEADSLARETDDGRSLTDCGYTRDQLDALRAGIFEPGGYVDVVVDQLRGGRFALYQSLLDVTDNHWGAEIPPFQVVANVHDLQLPSKVRGCTHRNGYQTAAEMAGVAFADGAWFTAGVDREGFRERATEFLRPERVEATLDDAVTVGSPVTFDAYEERYAEAPAWFHVAGSFWQKKHGERVLAVARRLHEEFGVRTVLTSMEPVPAEYRSPPWVEAHPEASRETYERALRKGDLALSAAEYETMARTPFEQAASGQVLALRDRPWIHDSGVPDDYPFVGDLDELADLAVRIVEDWERAVEANRRLVERVETVRGPRRVGERTYRDLRRRVDERSAACERAYAGTGTVASIAAAAEDAGGEAAVDTLNRLTAAHATDGRSVLDGEFTRAEFVAVLRSLGYRDTGRPGTPTFRTVG